MKTAFARCVCGAGRAVAWAVAAPFMAVDLAIASVYAAQRGARRWLRIHAHFGGDAAAHDAARDRAEWKAKR
jgi:hypothetical protein